MGENLMSLARSGGKYLKLFGDGKMVRSLPYLRRVAYLESHGTEYIDTGIIATSNDNISVTFKLVETRGMMFGSRAAFKSNAFYVYAVTNQFQIGWGDFDGQTYLYGLEAGVKTTIRNNGGLFELVKNGHVESSVNAGSYTFVQPVNFLLFTVNNNGVPRTDAVRMGIYEAIIGDRFLAYPVLDLSGRPAMYDEVSGQLFYNQGTGEFSWGEL